MKILTKIQLATLCVIAILGILCGFSPLALADTPAQTTTKPNPTLHVQNFQENELHTQFRYVNGLLTYIQFKNMGNKPIEIHIFGNNYVLGANDSVVINPPKVRYIVFTHELYPLMKTWVSSVFPERYAHEHIYRLPHSGDNVVSK